MFGLSQARLIGGAIAAAVLALAIWLLVQDRNHWKSKAAAYNAEVVNVLTATRIATNNPKLERPDVVAQIQLLGSGLQATKAAIDRQNAEIRHLGEERARLKQQADQAFAAGVKRAGVALEAQQRLEASARSPDRLKAPCALSDTLKEQWK